LPQNPFDVAADTNDASFAAKSCSGKACC